MSPTRRLPRTTAVLPGILLVVFSSAASATARQKPAAEPRVERQAPSPRGQTTGRGPAVLTQDDVDRDARETREQFRQLLNRYPPTLGRVLKLDPSLLSHEGYLAAYPAVAAFLAQHPDDRRHRAES